MLALVAFLRSGAAAVWPSRARPIGDPDILVVVLVRSGVAVADHQVRPCRPAAATVVRS